MKGDTSQARVRFAYLARWLEPCQQGTPTGPRRWWWETAVLIVVGLMLVVVVINASGFVSGIGGRTPADTATWRRFAHDDHATVSVTTLLIPQTRDVACGSFRPGPAGGEPRLCLLIVGSTVSGVRSVTGGWSLPAGAPDVPAYRRRCFGATIKQGLCPLEEQP